ncbi:MAG: hypothetical protein JZU50_15525 [Desulfobulbaceae bacterium]|nr:hypothetical protein [Desulfobulbaceae bacterium]
MNYCRYIVNRVVLTLLVIAAFHSTCSAENKINRYIPGPGPGTGGVTGTGAGAGALECGKYLDDQRRSKSLSQYEQWSLGYISGKNSALGKNLGAGISVVAIRAHVDNYCNMHTLHLYANAVEDLYKELSKK